MPDQDNEDDIRKVVQEEEQETDKIMPLVRLYFKIGGYFKINWQEFNDMPWPVIRQLAKLLDEKETDMGQFISYEEVAMFKNLRRMFPPTS